MIWAWVTARTESPKRVSHRGRRHAAGKRERERCGERHAAHDDEVGGFHERPLGWLQRSVDSGAALTRTTCCAWAAAGVRRFGCPPAGPACEPPPQDVRRRLRYARCGPRWRIRAARRRRQPVPASSAARPAPAAARPSPAARAVRQRGGRAGGRFRLRCRCLGRVCGAAAAPFAGWAPCLRTPPRPSMLPVAYTSTSFGFEKLSVGSGTSAVCSGFTRCGVITKISSVRSCWNEVLRSSAPSTEFRRHRERLQRAGPVVLISPPIANVSPSPICTVVDARRVVISGRIDVPPILLALSVTPSATAPRLPARPSG